MTKPFSSVHFVMVVASAVGVLALGGLAEATLGFGRLFLIGLLVPIAVTSYLLERTALMVAADGVWVDGRRTPWADVHELVVLGPPDGDLIELGLRRREDGGNLFARTRLQRSDYDSAELRDAFERFAPRTATLSGQGFAEIGQAAEPGRAGAHPPAGRSIAKTAVAALLLVLAVGGTIGYLWVGADDDSERDRVAQQLEEQLSADVLVRSSSQDPASLLERVQVLPHVASAVPLIEGDGQISGVNGPLGGGDGAAVVANWIIDDQLSPYTIIEGRAPEDPQEVVIDQRTAREGELNVGDTFVIVEPSAIEPESFAVSGIASLGPLDDLCEIAYVFLAPDAPALEVVTEAETSVGVLALASPDVASSELAAAAGGLPDTDVLDHDALVTDRIRRCQ